MDQLYRVLIDGQLINSESGRYLTITNPANGEPLARVPNCTEAELNRAVDAAERAAPAWAALSVAARSQYLYKIAAIIRTHQAELAPLETAQYGGPIWKTSTFDIPFASEIMEYYAGVSRAVNGLTLPVGPTCTSMVVREPLGVVGLITPWNFPLVTVLAKLAPALTTGNTVVIKPPSACPLTALKLGEYIIEAGVPAGVVNIVTGPGDTIGEALVRNPKVAKINFTGDSDTGKRIMAASSQTVKPMSMELGGKNAFIVMADADLEAAVEGAAWAAFYNSGQNCGSPSRFLVHETVYEQFKTRFVAAAQKIRVGDPAKMETMMGPLAYKGHRDGVEKYIAGALREGASLVMGGQRPDSAETRNGYFVTPTILENCHNQMTFMQDEIFGPVVGLLPFKTVEEALGIANDSRFGLCASIWTNNLREGLVMSRRLKVGTVWLNQHLAIVFDVPWGGTKQSGFGKENSILALDEYSLIKHVWIDLVGTPATPWQTKLR
jgi:acyl-CoA reductase-like NAD-dependent aldehyde dehydrogenase